MSIPSDRFLKRADAFSDAFHNACIKAQSLTPEMQEQYAANRGGTTNPDLWKDCPDPAVRLLGYVREQNAKGKRWSL